MILWTEKTAAEATGGKAQGTWQISRVEIDSRKIRPGDLFIAIKGENFDGHEFVADAFRKGAAAAVISRDISSPEGENNKMVLGQNNHNTLMVADTLKALEDLGKYARARCKAKIIGVTGSVGKTSTKEMLRLALAAHGKTFATGGNLNNHIGTPLNLANLPPDAQFAVFEMGMNHAGEISHLTNMVRPHVAAITTVEGVHMEFFKNIEAIAEAKSEIFEGVAKGGIAVLNRDHPLYGLMSARAGERGIKHILSFGANEEADCCLLKYEPTPTGCSIEADIFNTPMRYTLAAVGRHWAITSLLVLATTHALGLDDKKTTGALAGFCELEGRGRVVRTGGFTLIDDSYNASPAAMSAAFVKTAEVWESRGKKGRKVAALGNMLELGPDAPARHAELLADLEGSGFDLVFTAGDLMQHLHNALPAKLRGGHVAQAMQLLPYIQKELQSGDILLIKGSHGSKMYELAAALQNPQEKKHAV